MPRTVARISQLIASILFHVSAKNQSSAISASRRLVSSSSTFRCCSSLCWCTNPHSSAVRAYRIVGERFAGFFVESAFFCDFWHFLELVFRRIFSDCAALFVHESLHKRFPIQNYGKVLRVVYAVDSESVSPQTFENWQTFVQILQRNLGNVAFRHKKWLPKICVRSGFPFPTAPEPLPSPFRCASTPTFLVFTCKGKVTPDLRTTKNS